MLYTSGGMSMSSRLDTITDWETRAEIVGFRISNLAQGCGLRY